MESNQNRSIDILNSGLIGLSLVLAFYLPFKVFLLAYAILGPLHYLTEIHWLKTKELFIDNFKSVGLILSLLTVVISLCSFAKLWQPFLNDYVYVLFYSSIAWANTILFSSFLFVVFNKISDEKYSVYIKLFAAFFFGIVAKVYIPSGLRFFGLFVPTLMHVYVFTFLFMMHGFKRSRNNFGRLNLWLLVLVPLIIYIMPISSNFIGIKMADQMAMNASQFTKLHFALAKFLGESVSSNFVYESVLGRKIQIFIAFAYLYHYLNWFSKTSIIGWRKNLNVKSASVILVVWVGSLGIYWYDFSTGFIALFFLSFLHVILEFPLNVDTIKTLFKRW